MHHLGSSQVGLVTRFADSDAGLVLVLFGFQAEEADVAVQSRSVLRALLDGSSAPVVAEAARCVDAQGYELRMYLLYWEREDDYLQWWGRPDVQQWWATIPMGTGFSGVWKESVTTSSGRHAFATLAASNAGPARFLELVPSPHFGFAGSYRARLADSGFDGLSSEVQRLRGPIAADSFGRRLRVQLPENVCVIRQGQVWERCSQQDVAAWEAEMAPAIDAWVAELRDEPAATGCIDIRDAIEQDMNGDDVPRRSQIAFLLALDHIERSARESPAHLEIMRAFARLSPADGLGSGVNAWTEVLVPQRGGITADYVNCHGMTGFLPHFPSHSVEPQDA